jgi:hypothetical protein
MAPLLAKTGVIKDQHAVALGRQPRQHLDPLPVEVRFIPGHAGQQVVQPLIGGAGDHPGQGLAVLVGMLGQQARDIPVQNPGAGGLRKVDPKGSQKLRQLRHRLPRRLGDSGFDPHPQTYGSAGL